MDSPASINVSRVIDQSRLGAFQWTILVLCSLCLIMDGFDVQAIGYVAPVLSRDWHISGALLGSVLSAALMGVLFGSILFSMAADRLGRRPLLIAACLFFSVITLATARAQTVTELMILRFIAGLALGSIMPNAVSLVGEYSPRSVRVPMMIVVGTGFTAGSLCDLCLTIRPGYGRGAFQAVPCRRVRHTDAGRCVGVRWLRSSRAGCLGRRGVVR